MGYEPAWIEFPADQWNGIADPPIASALISPGTTGPPWIGIEVIDPAKGAARVHRHLRSIGRVAVVLALSPSTGTLAIASGVSTTVSRRFRASGLKPEDLEVLARCRRFDCSAAVQVDRIRRALSAADLGTRFFGIFQQTLFGMRDALAASIPSGTRHELALLQLTRVLFLHFVQARGWLLGDSDYLINGVDRCLEGGRHIERDFLHPLFFGTLNLPLAKRTGRARALGPLPFLNGGLFERHAVERKHRPILPNPVWRTVFDRLFQPFTFAATEGDGGIDPEMLGRVFEGVMQAEERHTSGTYYTPPELVQLLFRESLTGWLRRRLGCGRGMAERLFDQPDRVTRAALTDITILDPAVGSGAFLVCALQYLGAIPRGNLTPSQRQRRVLERNLFGVDRHPSAVRLTELRLWLELLAGDTGPETSGILPLPNLDGAVRQGDSLVDHLPSAGIPETAYQALLRTRQTVLTAHGPAKREAVRALRKAERTVAAGALARARRMLSDQAGDLRSAAQSPDLFGGRRPTLSQRRELERLQTELQRLRALSRRLSTRETVPWFQYAVQFGDILSGRGGFDIVVGNPPWIRAEHLPPSFRGYLRGRYRWWRAGSGTSSGYRHQPDLAVAFLERSLELVSPGGIVGLLLPAKLLTAGYGARCRRVVAERTTVYLAADLSDDPEIRFEATTYPLALVLSPTSPSPHHRVSTDFGEEGRIRQTTFQGGGPWIMIPDRTREVVERIEAEFAPISRDHQCHLGVKTGLNRVLLDPPPQVEPAVVRLALRGRDVGQFRGRPSSRILWPYDPDGNLLGTLPPVAAQYCATHAASLRRRSDYRTGPPWQLFRTRPLQAPACVVWPDLARVLTALHLNHPGRRVVPLNSCYLIPMPARSARAFAAWFNSTWLRALAWLRADRASSGYRRYAARTVGGLPAPPNPAALASLSQVNWIETTQEDLDDCCADLLNLSSRDRQALRRIAPSDSNHRSRVDGGSG